MKGERIRRLVSEGAWIVFGQVATVLGALVGIRLLTELLSPTEYGELGLWMTAATLISQVVIGPLSNGSSRFYAPALAQGDVNGYLAGVRYLLERAACILGLILLAIIAFLLATERTWLISISTATLMFAVISGCNSILGGVQNAARQRSVVALHQASETWARFLIAAAFLQIVHTTSVAVAIWGYAAASILILASQYRFFRKSVQLYKRSIENTDWKNLIWKYSWPFGAWGVFTWLQVASDRWVLNHFATSQEVGLYVVLYQLGYYPISMATGVALQFLEPILYARAGDGKDSQRNENVNKLTWRVTIFALMFTAIVSLFAFAFHPQIFTIFIAKEYGSVSNLLPWMVISGGVFAAGQTISFNLMRLMRTEVMIKVKIVTALLGVAFNLAGAYLYGTAGVVFAGVTFAVTYLGWMAILSMRVQKASI